ncbi:MAG: APC family permease [Candidatus Caldarchaeum sp.]|nr:APC family permease [Candidatus Caldarchaeum sp.]
MSRSQREVGYRREVGWLGSFALGYGDVGPNIFIALGAITIFAGGASPISFATAALLYSAVGLIYAELAPAYPYAGGVQVYSMRAFNSFVGFVSGWAMLLAYILCISLFAVAAAGYLRQIIPSLNFPDLYVIGVEVSSLGLLAGALASLLVALNILGIKYSSLMVTALVFLGLFIEALVLATGFLLKFDPALFLSQVGVIGSQVLHKDVAYYPFLNLEMNNFLYSITLAMASFVGIESIAQAAEETRRPHFSIPKATKLVVLVVAFSAIAFPVLAVGCMPWEELAKAYESPVYALVSGFPLVAPVLTPLVGLAAFILCYSSSNTGLVGVSRLTASMAKFSLLPTWLRVIHPRFRTPVRSIVLFGAVGVALSLLGDIPFLASVYAFAAVLSYLIIAPTFIKLRNVDRHVYFPWRQPLYIKVKGFEIPVIGLLGMAGLAVVFSLMIAFHAAGRLLGFLWILAGIAFYVVYRRFVGAEVFSRKESKMVEPLAYRIKVGVLVRPYEDVDTAFNSIVHAFDKRFDLKVVSIVETHGGEDKTIDQVREEVLKDMKNLCRRLRRDGYNADCLVELGEFETAVSSKLDEGLFDLAAYIQRRPEKSIFEKGHEKNIHNLITRYPGRILSLKRVGE